MRRKPAITIRMGAAHWDVTIHDPKGPIFFNLRKLHKDDLRAVIVGVVRAVREAGLVVT